MEVGTAVLLRPEEMNCNMARGAEASIKKR